MHGTPLTVERWRQVETLLLETWELPAEQRDSFLQARCGVNEDLLAEVRDLLAAQQSADNWTGPALPEPARETARRAGPFELERLIGRGGMGAVYLAHRADGQYEQKVAVKLVGLPFEIESFRERFRRERQILAGLNHPNITRLLDGGVTSDGELYLAMEYVEGIGLAEYCKQPAHAVEEKLRLFRDVCSAVQYAHQNLIVHRDIKPANILVTAEGMVKLLDFGTARLLEEAESTATGIGLMTPGYASPEQLRGEPATTVSDVFSLGVVLYEIIAGEKAFGTGIVARLEAGWDWRPPVKIPDDLDRIVGKALAADPAARYGSAEQLSEDVNRYLRGEPVLAHPAGFLYPAGKFLRRHKVGVALAALFIVGMTGATAFSVREARLAQKQAARAQHISQFLTDMLSSPNPSWYNTMKTKGKGVTIVDVLGELRDRIGRELSAEPDVEVELRRSIGRMYSVLGQHPEAQQQLNLALAKQLSTNGSDHADTARLYIALAAENYFTLHIQSAVDDARAALRILDRVGTSRDKQARAEADNALGVSLVGLGDMAAGEPPLREALQLSREVFGNKGSTPTAVGVLSTLTLQQGKFSETIPLAKESLALSMAATGKPAAETYAPLRDLGVVCMEQQDYDCAKSNLRQALDVAVQFWGPNSIYALGIRETLATADGLSGNPKPAEPVIEASRQAYISMGGSSLMTAGVNVHLARVQIAAKDFEPAAKNLRTAQALYEKSVRKDDIRLFNIMSLLGESLAGLGHLEEARPLLDKSYRDLLKALGPDHVWVRRAQARLAKLPPAL